MMKDESAFPPTVHRSGLLILHLSSFILFCVFAYALFFHGLAERDLWSSHEARAAQNAQSMLESGDWLLPRLFDGQVELQKPPLYYWLVAAIARMRGGPVDAWAVRLPAALSAAGVMLLVFVLLGRSGRPVAGLLAALMLGTMLHFTWLGRTGRVDMPLTLAVTSALSGFYLGKEAIRRGKSFEGRTWQLLGYASIAAGVMLKGPIGLILPAIVVGVCLLGAAVWAERDRPLERRMPIRRWRPVFFDSGLWWGLPLVALLSIPWFLVANQQTDGEFFREFFLRHNLQRGLGGDERLEEHAWWHYGPRVLGDLLPWSLLLPAAFVYLWRRDRWGADGEARFGLLWFAAAVVFLSCLRFKRADYLLPAYPGAAVLLGCMVERLLAELGRAGRRLVIASLAATGLLCVCGWLYFVDQVLPRFEPGREQRSFAAAVRRRVPRPGLVLLFRTESHAVVHHLGQSLDRIMEWENLDVWACQPAAVYVIMPPQEAAQRDQYLEAGKLYPVLSNTELANGQHEEPLVLLCNRPTSVHIAASKK